MDVKKISLDVSSILNADRMKRDESPSGTSFQKVLEEVRARASQCLSFRPSTEATQGLEFLTPPSIAPFGLKEATLIRSKGIQAADHALNLLEEYQKAIADPSLSLRQISPFIQSLSEGLKDLSLLSDQLSPSDPLKDLMTHTGIVSAIEVERFNRGDYI